MFMLNIFLKDKYFYLNLENVQHFPITAGNTNNADVFIQDYFSNDKYIELNKKEGKWYINDPTDIGLYYGGRKLKEKVLEDEDIYVVGKQAEIAVIVREITNDERDRVCFDFLVDNIETINIGKGSNNHIIIDNELVSKEHARIEKLRGKYVIRDLKSKNGTYKNGIRIKEAFLNEHDEIVIAGFRFVLKENKLIFYARNSSIKLNYYLHKRENCNYPYFVRSPRLINSLPSVEIQIELPPEKPAKPAINILRMIVAPLLGALVWVVLSRIMTNNSLFWISSIAMAFLSVIFLLIDYFFQKRKYINKLKLSETKYAEYIENIDKELSLKMKQAEIILFENNPDFNESMRRVLKLDRKLWERNNNDVDFMKLRIGIGDISSGFKINIPKTQLVVEKDLETLISWPEKIAEKYKFFKDVPVCVDFLKYRNVGIYGKNDEVMNILKSLVVQLTVSHSYQDVRVFCVHSKKDNDRWQWIKWFPHIWDNSKKVRYMANDKGTLSNLTCEFLEIINNCNDDTYLFFIVSDIEMIRNDLLMSILNENKDSSKLCTVFLSERMEELPTCCNLIIETVSEKGRIIDRQNSLETQYFVPDRISYEDAERLSRAMAPIRLVGENKEQEIPDIVSFLELFNASSADDLKIYENWMNSKPYESLKAPIGKLSENEIAFLDIHEKFHGPHGLVAGTTGSGKSELLITFILSLAVCYHPNHVVFIVIDYKGGGMANGLKDIPHLLGVLTNLQGGGVNRALISLKSELKRRQNILSDANANNIHTYMRLYVQGLVKQPMPYLIVIVDEFAELKAEHPEFIKELISFARVGRSLGIHLILATQKPSGIVDDQIWSNSKFRICLKVQETKDSIEIIRKPDAAYIKNPGRCCIQVGNDEVFLKIQSGFAGAIYDNDLSKEDNQNIYFVNIDGERVNPYMINKKEYNVLEKTQMDVVISRIRHCFDELNINKIACPWTKPLPERIFINEIEFNNNNFDFMRDKFEEGEIHKKETKNKWLSVPVGIADDPQNQRQFILNIEFGVDGHTAVYGSPGSGKTTFIMTFITLLAKKYTPNEANLYIIDFGSRILGVFEQLAHVGGIVYSGEEEKLFKLFKMIKNEVDQRKIIFSNAGVSNYYAYKNKCKLDLPEIVIIIDNSAALNELYPNIEEYILPIIREGGSLGIHFVITSNSISGIRFKVSHNISNILVLNMPDKADYTSLIGKHLESLPKNIPGRGVIKYKYSYLEFQTVLPVSEESDFENFDEIVGFIKEYNENWEGRKAKRIPVLPEKLTLENLVAMNEVTEKILKRKYIPIGLNVENAEPAFIDISYKHSLLVSLYGEWSQFGSEIYSSLINIFGTIFKENRRFYIVRTKVKDLNIGINKNICKTLKIIESSVDISDMVSELVEIMDERKKKIMTKITVSDINSIKDEQIDEFEPWFVIIDDLREFINIVENKDKDILESMMRKGSNLGVYFIFIGNSVEINRIIMFDSFTKSIVEMQHGLVLGGCLDNHMQFNTNYTNLPYTERSKPLGNSTGYYLGTVLQKILIIGELSPNLKNY